MSGIKSFDEFLKKGIVKKQSPDISRARFLINASERSLGNLNLMIEKIGINEENSDEYIKMTHDIILEALRADMLLEGFHASGFGAHEAEVSYARKLNMRENDVQFLDQIRYFRNGLLYYGTKLDKEYALKVIAFLKRVYPELKRDVLEKLRKGGKK